MISFDLMDPLSANKLRVQETLRTVIDPELNINIIDLGLVYGIDVSEAEKRIAVTMTLSSRFCPMGEVILQSVRNCLEHSYSDYTVLVNLTWEPQWNYENISEEGLRQLGR